MIWSRPASQARVRPARWSCPRDSRARAACDTVPVTGAAPRRRPRTARARLGAADDEALQEFGIGQVFVASPADQPPDVTQNTGHLHSGHTNRLRGDQLSPSPSLESGMGETNERDFRKIYARRDRLTPVRR